MSKIEEVLATIALSEGCVLKKSSTNKVIPRGLPLDVEYFYTHYDSVDFYLDEPFGIRIVTLGEVIPTNKVLYPEGDVIWEELEGDISNDWYLIAESEQVGQYISIDLDSNYLGQCYDSYIDIHAVTGEAMVIAQSFTELLERLCQSKGEQWYWATGDFISYGDAYEDREE
ncbi:SMI1/KNR4 family protein [Myroides sp. N17-2]|uniref:SMI1/KNR4 family protein n=1 Tax=Myroides sp. N17-2 TaxID=2030799 RepID=UPI000EFD06CE|nr:SMI1/KNR4 family protein [Myroides sp. N17-2]